MNIKTMKKNILYVAIVLMAGSLLTTSCIGSFALFNKYEKWQCNMTSSKIANGIVGFILQPICAPVCGVVDALVLNTIEFWSGNNPLSASVTREVIGSDGRLYAITKTSNGYQITDPEGVKTMLTHNEETDTWSLTMNGETRELFRFKEDGTIEAIMKNGQVITVTNDESGLQAMREAVWDGNCFAMN